ncbi:MAG TPA: DUF4199 domain-containing protein [Pyrinomonadaceae bacterium]|nr:DUF4199 domain-containing protein [Pyrinomonadaceae bacterium]
MKKIVLTFGVISGVIASVLMLSTLLFIDRIGFDKGLFVGYTGIVLSFLVIFPGIRSYRENIGNGTISFGRAFAVGILITLISCAFYIATWQLIYYKLMPDFADKCFAYMMEQIRNSGKPPAEVAAEIESTKQFIEAYRNPFVNAAYTFIEPFPVGLLVTLISSLILRKKRKETGSTEVVTTSV